MFSILEKDPPQCLRILNPMFSMTETMVDVSLAMVLWYGISQVYGALVW